MNYKVTVRILTEHGRPTEKTKFGRFIVFVKTTGKKSVLRIRIRTDPHLKSPPDPGGKKA